MKTLWPELLVLVLFLIGDIFFTGLEAAAAGVVAGLSAYLVLFFTGKKKPALIVEGFVFGAVTALGTIVQFPGGSLILMELVLGLILLISVPVGWNLLERMSRGLGKGLFSSEQARIMSIALGSAFTLHALVFAGLHLMGFGNPWIGIVLFSVLYIVSLRLSAGKMRSLRKEESPAISDTGDGLFKLTLKNDLLGTFRLTDGSLAEVSEVHLQVEEHRFLSNLEVCLKKLGFTSVSISQWQESELELQMRGYSLFDGKWRRTL